MACDINIHLSLRIFDTTFVQTRLESVSDGFHWCIFKRATLTTHKAEWMLPSRTLHEKDQWMLEMSTFPDAHAETYWHWSRWTVSASSFSRKFRHRLQPLLTNSAAHSFLANRPVEKLLLMNKSTLKCKSSWINLLVRFWKDTKKMLTKRLEAETMLVTSATLRLVHCMACFFQMAFQQHVT